MTVKELIECLSRFPQSAEVVIDSGSDGCGGENPEDFGSLASVVKAKERSIEVVVLVQDR